MNKVKILAPSYVIPITEVDGLVELKERMEIKLRQLESNGFEEFGGLGTGEDLHNREAYLRMLRWLLYKDPNATEPPTKKWTANDGQPGVWF